MISHRHKVILVHVPRCAGTSMEIALGFSERWLRLAGRLYARRVLFGWDPKLGLWLQHASVHELAKHRLVRPGVLSTYFKFAFVRNPWDRTVSEYRRWGLEKGLSFQQFVRGQWEESEPTRVADRNVHAAPQADFLYDEQRQIGVDFVGQFERLEADWASVCARIGKRIQLPTANATSHDHYSAYYDDETMELIARRYRTDIDAFGYRFDRR